LGDTYREEIKRHHKKSGFGPDPGNACRDFPRTLLEERRALRADYFKEKARKARPKSVRNLHGAARRLF